MKIGIDTSPIRNPVKTGCGNYVANLTDALWKVDSKNEYTHYSSSWKMDVAGKIGLNDILHSTAFTAPKNRGGKLIVTIYDVTFITHPQVHSKENIKVCTDGTWKAVENADHIITLSECSKRDIAKYFKADPKMITVTPLAAGPQFKPSNIQKGNYIFALRADDPRKNIDTLKKAHTFLPEDIQEQYPLVCTGTEDLKYVPDRDLPALYARATMFVYPSLYEGFGLPILEAMACGTPVITSETSSMPVVGGDAALYIDPNYPEELAESIMQVIQNKPLRDRMIAQGLIRASQYSWEKTATDTIAVYNKVTEYYAGP